MLAEMENKCFNEISIIIVFLYSTIAGLYRLSIWRQVPVNSLKSNTGATTDRDEPLDDTVGENEV